MDVNLGSQVFESQAFALGHVGSGRCDYGLAMRHSSACDQHARARLLPDGGPGYCPAVTPDCRTTGASLPISTWI